MPWTFIYGLQILNKSVVNGVRFLDWQNRSIIRRPAGLISPYFGNQFKTGWVPQMELSFSKGCCFFSLEMKLPFLQWYRLGWQICCVWVPYQSRQLYSLFLWSSLESTHFFLPLMVQATVGILREHFLEELSDMKAAFNFHSLGALVSK